MTGGVNIIPTNDPSIQRLSNELLNRLKDPKVSITIPLKRIDPAFSFGFRSPFAALEEFLTPPNIEVLDQYGRYQLHPFPPFTSSAHSRR